MIERSRNSNAGASKHLAMNPDDVKSIRPDGLSIRRMRHDRGWSPRDMVDAIASACERATGLRETITPNVLKAIEEHNEHISYATLCLVADGLGCDPTDILPSGFSESQELTEV